MLSVNDLKTSRLAGSDRSVIGSRRSGLLHMRKFMLGLHVCTDALFSLQHTSKLFDSFEGRSYVVYFPKIVFLGMTAAITQMASRHLQAPVLPITVLLEKHLLYPYTPTKGVVQSISEAMVLEYVLAPNCRLDVGHTISITCW